MNNHSNDSFPEEIQTDISDYNLDWPAWCLDSLKSLALEQKLPRPRSLAWAILLHVLPPPNANFINVLKSHRRKYEELVNKLTMDPRVVIGDDPLSQNEESAWKQHFCDNELKALILQDVVRTFPDELYFRDKDVQNMMVRVLFAWSRRGQGYRQGMHEVLAPLLLELHLDRARAPRGLSDTLKFYLKEDCLEHDSYMLFDTVMKGIERFYSTGDVVPSPCGRFPTSSSVHNPNEVVRYLDRIRTEYLMTLDPELATHLTDCNISLELFGIRWLRLLFGREFARSEVPALWGFLFSEGPTLPHVHFVLLAMLLSMRAQLLASSPGSALSLLMKPLTAPCGYVVNLARHLHRPRLCARPHTPPQPATLSADDASDDDLSSWSIEERSGPGNPSHPSVPCSAGRLPPPGEGYVSSELALLGLLRRRLPGAVRALRAALPATGSHAAPLRELMQLTSLLECRNHALIDVETALEAAEGDIPTEKLGKRQLIPVSLIGGRRNSVKTAPKSPRRIKEYQLKVFHQAECAMSDNLPCLDPLRLRTE